MNTRKALVIISILGITLLMGCHKNHRIVLQSDIDLYQGGMLTVYQNSYNGQRTSLEIEFNDTISEACITTIKTFDNIKLVDSLEGVNWRVPIDVSILDSGEDLDLSIKVYYRRDSLWQYDWTLWLFH